jgi:hypothetical protein
MKRGKLPKKFIVFFHTFYDGWTLHELEAKVHNIAMSEIKQKVMKGGVDIDTMTLIEVANRIDIPKARIEKWLNEKKKQELLKQLEELDKE